MGSNLKPAVFTFSVTSSTLEIWLAKTKTSPASTISGSRLRSHSNFNCSSTMSTTCSDNVPPFHLMSGHLC